MKEHQVKLSKFKIRLIVAISESISECILNLYSAVIPYRWADIECFNTWPQCNNDTAMFILDRMKTKWDPVSCGLLWMNKGFSSYHNQLNDFQILIPENCYTLTDNEEIDNIIHSLAKKEVEEYYSDEIY